MGKTGGPAHFTEDLKTTRPSGPRGERPALRILAPAQASNNSDLQPRHPNPSWFASRPQTRARKLFWKATLVKNSIFVEKKNECICVFTRHCSLANWLLEKISKPALFPGPGGGPQPHIKGAGYPHVPHPAAEAFSRELVPAPSLLMPKRTDLGLGLLDFRICQQVQNTPSSWDRSAPSCPTWRYRGLEIPWNLCCSFTIQLFRHEISHQRPPWSFTSRTVLYSGGRVQGMQRQQPPGHAPTLGTGWGWRALAQPWHWAHSEACSEDQQNSCINPAYKQESF